MWIPIRKKQGPKKKCEKFKVFFQISLISIFLFLKENLEESELERKLV